jgi:hypothetical protein
MQEWAHRIQATHSLDDLAELCRVYLATWYPADLGRVPEECRPTRVKGSDDIFFWRDRLLEMYCARAATDEGEHGMRDMLAFFAAAADRALHLRGTFDPLATIPPLFSDNSIPRLFTSAHTGGDGA